MEDCFSCKYCGNNIEQDPCRWCGFTKGSGSRWEPRDAATVTADWYQKEAEAYARSIGYVNMLHAVRGLKRKSDDLSTAISQNIYQNIHQVTGLDLDSEKLISLVAEAQMYLAILADGLGVTLGEIMLKSIEEMQETEDTPRREKAGE